MTSRLGRRYIAMIANKAKWLTHSSCRLFYIRLVIRLCSFSIGRTINVYVCLYVLIEAII